MSKWAMNYKAKQRSSKLADSAKVGCACLFAIIIGILIAVPIILRLELIGALIDYLNRH